MLALYAAAKKNPKTGCYFRTRCGLPQWLPVEFRADREIVLAAVSLYGPSLSLASNDLRDDRDFVLAAVRNNGSALMYASKQWQADEEIVSLSHSASEVGV